MATPAALNAREQEQFDTQGYLVFPGFFDEPETNALKHDIDDLTTERTAVGNQNARRPYEFPDLGRLISHPKVMGIAGDVLGPGFAFHHLHAVRQGPGSPAANWHQDYEQAPQTNRSHAMIHVFYYLNGLNGEVGDLLLVPGTQGTVVANGALSFLGTQDLPGMVVVDDLPPGSAVLVHSALWHARRAKPGGEDAPRYFADASYCQAGVRWPCYPAYATMLPRLRELGIDRGGQYAHLFDERHFFDTQEILKSWKPREGSLALAYFEAVANAE